ncbi:hypothetical protein mRhiFer1_009543 [Rhinolophus ferrumequinum]|uniref:Uncharacterized protein n=1 Tax=Rhinolophus ferrumequinum TaxID=59479 RepID=A0A7J7R8F3_RHIFE|nr:hypothetical protein mRhiFer1_009543 [Rhinolophus ferrumequinum]
MKPFAKVRSPLNEEALNSSQGSGALKSPHTERELLQASVGTSCLVHHTAHTGDRRRLTEKSHDQADVFVARTSQADSECLRNGDLDLKPAYISQTTVIAQTYSSTMLKPLNPCQQLPPFGIQVTGEKYSLKEYSETGQCHPSEHSGDKPTRCVFMKK